MNLAFFVDLFPHLLQGTLTTLLLLVISSTIGTVLAALVAIGRLSHRRWIHLPLLGFMQTIRGTPLLVQIYLLYYGLGSIFAANPAIRESVFWPFLREGFWYAVVALTISTAAYSGEVLRGALAAVPAGELEAARALGLHAGQSMRLIRLPRAIQICLPALGGETILSLKATALASTITVVDMMGAANRVRSETFRTYEPLLAAALIYIVMTFIITRLFLLLERRLGRERAR